jgi:hypothetical protein
MAFKIRRLLSVFFLLTFLFPPTVEAVHSFGHRNDNHCTERSIIHFHAEEHHCNICDYSQTPTYNTFLYFDLSGNKIISTETFLQHADPIFESHRFNFSYRGPPII